MIPYMLPAAAVGTAIGIWVQENWNVLGHILWLLVFMAGIVWLTIRKHQFIGKLMLLFFLCCCTGILIHGQRQEGYDHLSHEILGSSGYGNGVIVSDKKVFADASGVSYLVALQQWGTKEQERAPVSGTIKLNLAAEPENTVLEQGDKIQFFGTLRKPVYYHNQGMYDFIHRDKRENIIGRMYGKPENILAVETADASMIDFPGWRQRLQEIYAMYVSPQASYLLSSLLFGGNYDRIDPAILESFAHTGLIHILSVSGSHMALLMGLAGYAGKRLRLRGIALWLTAGGIIFSYMGMAGFTAPVVRSGIMGFAAFTAVAIRKRYSGIHALALAVLGMLVWNSYTIFDLSFQLSVGASLGILLFYRKLCWKFYKLPFGLNEIAAITVASHILILPLLWRNFQMMPIYTLPANVISGFLLDSLIAAGIVTAGPFMILPPELTGIILSCMESILNTAVAANRFFASLPHAVLDIPPLTIELEILYYCIVFIYFAKKRTIRPYWKAARNAALAVAVAGAVVWLYSLYVHNGWSGYRLDVGTGTAVAWKNNDGSSGLYYRLPDMLSSQHMVDMVLVPSLRYHGIFSLNTVYLTGTGRQREDLEQVKERLKRILAASGTMKVTYTEKNEFVLTDGNREYRIGGELRAKRKAVWEYEGARLKRTDGLGAIVYNSTRKNDGEMLAMKWHVPGYDVAQGEISIKAGRNGIDIRQYDGR